VRYTPIFLCITFLLGYGYLRAIAVSRSFGALGRAHPAIHGGIDAFLSFLMFFLVRHVCTLMDAFEYSYFVETYLLYVFPLLPLLGSRLAVFVIPQRIVFSGRSAIWLWIYSIVYSYLYLGMAIVFFWPHFLGGLRLLNDIGLLSISEDSIKGIESKFLDLFRWPSKYSIVASRGLFVPPAWTFLFFLTMVPPWEIIIRPVGAARARVKEGNTAEEGERLDVSLATAKWRAFRAPVGPLCEAPNMGEDERKLFLTFQKRILWLPFWTGWIGFYIFCSTWAAVQWFPTTQQSDPSGRVGGRVSIALLAILLFLGDKVRLFLIAWRAGIPFRRAVRIRRRLRKKKHVEALR